MTTANIFSFSDTWNDSGTTFNAIKVDVTDGASASDSTLIDLQVGSTSQFKVDKGGIITANGFLAEGNVDLQGNRLVLDADNDSYINVNGDDSVSVYISGSEVLKFDGSADDKLILDGVSFAPTGAVVGQALGYPNSTTTLEPYTPAGGGDLLAALNLSDVDDAATAKTNIRVSVATIAALEALNGADLTDGELISVSGYAAAGDGEARLVVYDSGSSATANAVTIFEPADGTGRFIHQGVVRPEHAGVFVGTADNTPALQRLADANVDCNFGGNLYSHLTQIDLPEDFNATWENGGVDISGAGNIAAIRGDGADFEDLGALTGNASAGDTTVAVTDSSSLNAGDIVLIHSNREWNDEHALASEYQRVISESSGTVTLSRPLFGDALTADSAALKRFVSTLSPTFKDFTVQGAGGSSTQNGIFLVRPYRARFINCRGFDTRQRFIRLDWDIFTQCSNTYVQGADQSGFGYGIAASGGWGGSYGDLTGARVRHMVTFGDSASTSGSNTPSFVVMREFMCGDVHCDDAESAIIDTHGGCIDGVFGNTSGSMRDGVSQSAVTMQGARMTIGDVNVTGVDSTGVAVESFGMDDGVRENFFVGGNFAITKNEDVAGWGVLVRTISVDGARSKTVPMGRVVLGSVFINQGYGVRLRADNGDIDSVSINGGNIFSPNYDGLQILDSASYRVKRVVVRDAKITNSVASGRYPIYAFGNTYYDANRSVAGAMEFTTILDFYNCQIENTADNIIARNRECLVRFWNCELNGSAAAGDIFFRDSTTGSTTPVGAFAIDGVAHLETTIASGIADAIPNSVVAVEGEGSLDDTLNSLTVPADFIATNGGFDGDDVNQGSFRVQVKPRSSGQTITLAHSASGANTFRCPAGQDVVLSSQDHSASLYLDPLYGQWVVDGVTINSTLTSTSAYFDGTERIAFTDNNTAVGRVAITGTGDNNVCVGRVAGGTAMTTAFDNVCAGSFAGDAITSGFRNVIIGPSAGTDLTEGDSNLLLGYIAGANLTTGSSNTALGRSTLFAATTASNNVAIGNSVLAEQTGNDGVAIGYLASQYLNGADNTAIGSLAARGSTGASTGSGNTAIGHSSLQNITTGIDNVCIGKNAGDVITTGSNNIMIGDAVDPSGATASNEINIGGAIITTVGTQVIGDQQSAIADLSVTFTANAPAAADGSITIADGSAPTNDELLEYCAENDAKIDSILAALRAHGLIAT